MAFPQGINFRSTAGYVTDGTGEDYEISGAVNYPRTTAQGNTVGWETLGGGGAQTRDRNSGNDRRLAGMSWGDSGGTSEYRIDLPSSGNYNVRVAAGEAVYGTTVYVEAFDTTTSLSTLVTSGTTSAGNQFKDATNTEYSAANWPGSNTAAALTFSTTICRFRVGSGATQGRIAHLYIESAGGGATTRGTPFGTRGTAFNGGRTFLGIIR